MARRSAQAGFTLLETLVAMAILGLILAAALQVVAGGAQVVDVAQRQARLAAVANGLLEQARLPTATPPQPHVEGETAGVQWSIDREPYVDDEMLRSKPAAVAKPAELGKPAEPPPPALWRVHVAATDPGGLAIGLTTLAVAPAK